MSDGRRERIRLTRAQVREIDRRAVEEYHVPGVVLMENAARAVTDVALDMLRGIDGPAALIVCGGGNNGGDGLAVARHLHNRGVSVTLAMAVKPSTYAGEAAVNWRIVEAMKLPAVGMADITNLLPGGTFQLIVDALFGTGLRTPPRQPQHIEAMNRAGVPILAVDVPSGLDCDTGEVLGPACVRATRTVTFVAEKVGFSNPVARQYLGDVIVGDIGCPRDLIDSVAAGESPH